LKKLNVVSDDDEQRGFSYFQSMLGESRTNYVVHRGGICGQRSGDLEREEAGSHAMDDWTGTSGSFLS
jgi:hypothetical protein